MSSLHEEIFRTSAVPVLESTHGVLVRLKRGTDESVLFTARRAGVDYDTPGADFGLQVVVRMRDYILPANEILIDSEITKPQHRDKLLEGSEVLEIVPVGKFPAVEYQPATNEYLVHAQLIQS
jgi:hypothetical protein